MDACSIGIKSLPAASYGILPNLKKKTFFAIRDEYSSSSSTRRYPGNVFHLFRAHQRPMHCTERRTQASEPTLVFIATLAQQDGTTAVAGTWCGVWTSPQLGMGYGILCWWYGIYMGIWENHTMWYGTCWHYGTGKTQYMVRHVCGMVPWYDVVHVFYMAKFAWWYGMFQYKRSVRVEYVVRI